MPPPPWLTAGALASALLLAGLALPSPEPRRYRGALHVHTTNSDGAASPEETLAAYRAVGFDFVALTDHDRLPGQVRTRVPLLLSGQEVSCSVGRRPVHLNVFGLDRRVGSAPFPSAAEALGWTLARVAAEGGGLVQLNHPNYRAGVSWRDLLAFPGVRLLEIDNPHDSRPGLEDFWDRVLADRHARPERCPLYGTAVDDSNQLSVGQVGGLGNGWVTVQAPELSSRAVLQALEAGRFYASTGVELESWEADPQGLALEVRARPGVAYRILFVGTRRGGVPGEVLAEVAGERASYRFRGDELYARARVESTEVLSYDRRVPRRAWTQPAPGPACPWPAP